MIKKILIALFLILIISIAIFIITYNNNTSNVVITENKEDNINIEIKEIENNKYTFIYNDETYNVVYWTDNWKIINSYKIRNKEHMKIICEKLLEIHKIHGEDKVSYRTVDDMVFEWEQHNIGYDLLPNDNKWKDTAKDVDFDPKDQNKTLKDMYEMRTGKELNIYNLSI
jgi:hypothetical protein